MTVSTEIIMHSYYPGSIMAEERIPFQFLDAHHLVVTEVGSLVPLLAGTDYVISGDGRNLTATIRMQRAFAEDQEVRLRRSTALRQEAVTTAFRPLPAEDVGRELDRRALIEQEFSYAISRSPQIPIDGKVNGQFPVVMPDGSWGFGSGTGNDPALRSDLAVPTGGKGGHLVAWRLPAGSAVDRNIAEKMADAVSVKDFGAIGDGTLHTVSEWIVPAARGRFANFENLRAVYPHVTSMSDSIDWAASQAAINYSFSTANQGGTVNFPDGVYLVNRAIHVDGSGLALVGHSANSAQIVTTSESENIIEIGATAGVNEGIRILGLGFAAPAGHVDASAIHIHNAVNLVIDRIRCIENCWNGISIQGDTGSTLGIYISNFDLKLIRNIGIDVGSVAGATDVFVSNGLIRPRGMAFTAIRLVQSYGFYCQNVDVTNFGPEYFTHGLLISPNDGQQCNATMLTNVLLDSTTNATLMFSGDGRISDFQAVGSWFCTSAGDNGVTFSNPRLNGAKIVASHLHASARIGILINSGKNIMIANNFIFGNSRETHAGYDGITVAAGVSMFTITGNQIGDGGYFETIDAGGTHRHGINVNIGASNGYIISHNLGKGNADAFVADNGTGEDKYVDANIGLPADG